MCCMWHVILLHVLHVVCDSIACVVAIVACVVADTVVVYVCVAIIFNSQSSHVPFRVLSSTPLLPMVLSTPPQHHHHHHHHHLLSQPTKSPFRIIPIPSINKTQPEELPNVSQGVGPRGGVGVGLKCQPGGGA